MTLSNDVMSSFWMPYTPNRAFNENPRLLRAADGMYYTSDDGRQILDSSAGLWCVNAGHNRPKIVEAVQKQVATMDYAPHFNFGTPEIYDLSTRLAGMFPGDLNHAFFCNSGSEAVDTALKIAIHYHRMRGDAARTRLIGRERGYHGSGFGGISVGGIVKNRMHYGSMLTGVDHLRHTHDLDRNAFSKGCPEHGAELADDLIRMAELHDPSTIAAVIVEPVAGSTGVLIPPVGYLRRLRELCDRYGILLIFDEVITAYGRLGKASAAEYFDVIPDIITTAKGLTNGTIPMGAVMVSSKIYQSAMDNADAPIELFHGYTYSAHPIAVAAALATLDTYAEDGLFERGTAMTPVLEAAVHGLSDNKHVKDIRNLGMVAGIELHARDGAVGARGVEVLNAAWDAGVMLRVTGDTIALSPPLIITEAEIERIVTTISDILGRIA